MPNYVTNIVAFKGKREDVENVLIYIQGMGNGDKEIIDFEAISPMPEELKRIRANPKILSEEEYALEMIDFKERQINPTDIDRLVGDYWDYMYEELSEDLVDEISNIMEHYEADMLRTEKRSQS